MRRATTTLALALSVLGCGPAPAASEPFDLLTSWEPGSAPGNPCPAQPVAPCGGGPACRPGWHVDGELVVDPNGGTAVKVESDSDRGTVGTMMAVMWWPTFSGLRVGDRVEVLDPEGKVVAITGLRYRIMGSFEQIGFVACGDEVIPK
jgi:hypothetical protein